MIFLQGIRVLIATLCVVVNDHSTSNKDIHLIKRDQTFCVLVGTETEQKRKQKVERRKLSIIAPVRNILPRWFRRTTRPDHLETRGIVTKIHDRTEETRVTVGKTPLEGFAIR